MTLLPKITTAAVLALVLALGATPAMARGGGGGYHGGGIGFRGGYRGGYGGYGHGYGGYGFVPYVAYGFPGYYPYPLVHPYPYGYPYGYY